MGYCLAGPRHYWSRALLEDCYITRVQYIQQNVPSDCENTFIFISVSNTPSIIQQSQCRRLVLFNDNFSFFAYTLMIQSGCSNSSQRIKKRHYQCLIVIHGNEMYRTAGSRYIERKWLVISDYKMSIKKHPRRMSKQVSVYIKGRRLLKKPLRRWSQYRFN